MNEDSLLPMGFSKTPPASPWGANFGGGTNSTAMIVECRNRGFKPDWILFADTGSELPGTLEHVEAVRKWCEGWVDVTVVRWIRKDGTFEALHDNCLRTEKFPSKAYGNAGCTSKWKIYPMEKWRKEHGFDRGAFAVGYDAGEDRRITKACQRGDMPDMTAWYPLVAWNIDRAACDKICASAGFVPRKTSCFMCPNMKEAEWADLKRDFPDYFELALEIERRARDAGESPQAGMERLTAGFLFDPAIRAKILAKYAVPGQTSLFGEHVDDRCHHGGCFT